MAAEQNQGRHRLVEEGLNALKDSGRGTIGDIRDALSQKGIKTDKGDTVGLATSLRIAQQLVKDGDLIIDGQTEHEENIYQVKPKQD